jgi:Ca-activated chloride channel homolog
VKTKKTAGFFILRGAILVKSGGDFMVSKKLLSIVLVVLVVITGSLTGCSSKSKNDASTSKDTSGGSRYEKETEAEDSMISDTAESSVEYDTSDDGMNGYDISEEKSAAASDASTSDNDTDTQNRYSMNYDQAPANNEEYSEITEIGFKDTSANPLSTFSIDVDTASYTNLRKNLNNGILPEADAVRIEEMLNYFQYDYVEPHGNVPFSINTEIGECPWNEDNYLLTIGILGKSVEKDTLPKSNLVFLIDVSGSMDEPDKLPLLKNAFSKLVEQLGENDRISIVVYAGESGVVLDSVPGSDKDTILDAIDSLSAGGSTGGAAGIDLAYRLAEKNFMKEGNNRIILATDGDFNVGPSSVEDLEEIIAKKKESGIFLSVMGFGSGNLKDNRMETLADKGNGNYSYIDCTKEARKVLVDEMAGTLLTIAKDVKIQIEFNPYSVAGYRLIGYENRALKDEDFEDDTVDAGELGAGHRVTAVYEIIPVSSSITKKDLKYQSKDTEVNTEYRNEISEIRLRYKEPAGDESKEIKRVVSYQNTPVNGKAQSEDFYFAASVVEFGMILRNSEYKGNASIDSVLDLAEKGLGEDEEGYRLEFMNLVDQYEDILNYQW